MDDDDWDLDLCQVCGRRDWLPIGHRYDLTINLTDDGASPTATAEGQETTTEWICGACGCIHSAGEADA